MKHVLTRGWASAGNSITKRVEVEADAEHNLDVPLAAGANNALVAFTADVSQLQSFFLVSDQAVTVKTNSSGFPANTFTLLPGQPFMWITGDPALRDTAAALVTTDITSLFVTNAGDSPAVLNLRAPIDPTV